MFVFRILQVVDLRSTQTYMLYYVLLNLKMGKLKPQDPTLRLTTNIKGHPQ